MTKLGQKSVILAMIFLHNDLTFGLLKICQDIFKKDIAIWNLVNVETLKICLSSPYVAVETTSNYMYHPFNSPDIPMHNNGCVLLYLGRGTPYF